MADDEGLAGQGIGGEGGKEKGHFSHIFNGGEFVIDGAAQHDALYNLVFRDAEGFCLFRNLLFHEWRLYKPRADDIGTDTMLCTFLCNNSCDAQEAVFGRDVS
jgi:hypothetical protein